MRPERTLNTWQQSVGIFLLSTGRKVCRKTLSLLRSDPDLNDTMSFCRVAMSLLSMARLSRAVHIDTCSSSKRHLSMIHQESLNSDSFAWTARRSTSVAVHRTRPRPLMSNIWRGTNHFQPGRGFWYGGGRCQSQLLRQVQTARRGECCIVCWRSSDSRNRTGTSRSGQGPRSVPLERRNARAQCRRLGGRCRRFGYGQTGRRRG